MSDAPLTLGTAGHIDHGKTALVRALTGVDTDRLPQERERGISIELGFAQLALPSGRTMSVVDVPGHERFVRTMVAGATGIDLFLLVVAADDGVMPQTREHLAVLELLAVPAGVVAVTKADVGGGEAVALARADVEEQLRGGPYAGAPIVTVSATRGTGLEELRAQIDAAADAIPARDLRSGPPRLHVDRCFTLRGIGTVVTGTLWSGSMARGDEVRLEPQGRRARVRAVEVHGEARDHAGAGQRVALNLAGVERDEVERGDVAVAGNSAARPSYVLDASARLTRAARPLRGGARVQVHHGTREAPARVVPLDGEKLQPGADALVQLRLERPLIALSGDRFVIRSIAPPDTIGGGVVLDAAARKHGPGAAHARRLRALASSDPLELLRIELETAQSGIETDPAGVVEQLAATGAAVPAGRPARRWFSPALLERAQSRLLDAVAAGDGARPLSASALADACGLEVPAAAAVLDDLAAEDRVERQGGGYLPAGTAATESDPAARVMIDLLRTDGVEPRPVDDLATTAGVPPPAAAATLDRLARSGAIARVKPRLYYHPEALARARSEVQALCDRHGAVTIASLRDRLGTSRKYAQALLEHFDAARVTRRVGDEHVLRPGRPPAD